MHRPALDETWGPVGTFFPFLRLDSNFFYFPRHYCTSVGPRIDPSFGLLWYKIPRFSYFQRQLLAFLFSLNNITRLYLMALLALSPCTCFVQMLSKIKAIENDQQYVNDSVGKPDLIP
jgi:hypothetical protein